jgi:hypothetical protein
MVGSASLLAALPSLLLELRSGKTQAELSAQGPRGPGECCKVRLLVEWYHWAREYIPCSFKGPMKVR